MQFLFNNKSIIVKNFCISIADFIREKGYVEGCFAVMMNGNFIPKSEYSGKFIYENDEVNIILPMQGG